MPPGAASRGRGGIGAGVALCCLLSLAFFWKPLVGEGILLPTNPRSWQPWAAADAALDQGLIRSNPLMGDALILTYPWRLFNSEMLRRGEIPFWNPFIFCGYPHLAALQSNALHPLTAPFDLWDPVRGIACTAAIALALAGCLMLAFLIRLGLGVDAAIFGAVAFELNGFFLVRLSAPSYLLTGLWLPLLLLGVTELAAGAVRRGGWKIVVAVAMALLGGHPQIFVLTLAAGLAYLLFALRGRRAGLRAAVGRLAGAAVAVALGLGIVGFQLLPFLELVGETSRSAVDFASYQKLALPPLAGLQALVPDLFGHPVDATYWFPGPARFVDRAPDATAVWSFNYCGENLYTGIVPLVFAVFALLRSRARESVFFSGLAAAALAIVFGTPLLRLAYHLVPTFQHSRADRVIFLYMVAVAVLAALGYDAAARRGRPGLGPAARVNLSLVAALGALVLWPVLADPGLRAGFGEFLDRALARIGEHSGVVGPQAVAALLTVIVSAILIALLRRTGGGRWILVAALALLVVPLFRFGWHFNPVQPRPLFPSAPALEAIRGETARLGRIARLGGAGLLPPNLPQVFALYDVNGASAAALGRYADLVGSLDVEAFSKGKYFRSFAAPSVLAGGLLDLLGVETVISNRRLDLPELRSSDPRLRLYRNPGALPRFFLVGRVEVHRSTAAAAGRLLEPSFPRALSAVVDSGRSLHLDAGPFAAAGETVEVVAYDPHRIRLDVRAAARKLLVSSEADYPSWEVYVDGQRAESVRVNTAFRGVVVPAGRHRVEFRYVPRSFYLGLAASALSLIALGAAWRGRAAAR